MRRAALLAVALALASGPWRATAQEEEWYKYYDSAQKAIQAGRWAEAVQSLLATVNRRPRPSARAKGLSNFYFEYHPYIDLVEAYVRLGQWGQAQAEMGHLEVQEFKEFRNNAKYVQRLGGLREKIRLAGAAAPRDPTPPPSQRDAESERLMAEGEAAYQAGQYDAARRAFAAVRERKADAEWVKRAAGYVQDIDRETRDWNEGKAAFEAGQFTKAVESLQRVVDMGKSLAAGARDLRDKAGAAVLEEKTKNQSLQGNLEFARTLTRQGKYETALDLLERYEPEDTRAVKEEIRQRMRDDALSALSSGDLNRVENLVRGAEEVFPQAVEFAAIKERCQLRRKMDQATAYMGQKRWSEAKVLLDELAKSSETKAEATRRLQVISERWARMKQDLAAVQKLLDGGQQEQALKAIGAAQAEFPGEEAVQSLARRIRESRIKSGSLDVEEYIRGALEEFFDTGDYSKARFQLDEYIKRGGSRKDLALYFRAAAAVYLSQLKGGGEKALLDAARRDVAALSPSFSPPRKWLSPSALDLLDNWRAGK